MPKRIKALDALEVERITKDGLHAVGGVAGLMLQVTDTGARSWILRAMVGRKRRDIGLGGYPSVSLFEARERARAARGAIFRGIDPVVERKAARARIADAAFVAADYGVSVSLQDSLKSFCAVHGYNMRRFVRDAIEEKMIRDNATTSDTSDRVLERYQTEGI